MSGVVAESVRNRLLTGLAVEQRVVKAAGVDTLVIEGGEGAALVLLHGPGEFAEAWTPVIGQLSRTHRVIATDLPGHGASQPIRQLARDSMVAWLDDVVTATCDHPPTLVGRVVGGAIGLDYAAAQPDRLARLVLVDSMGLAPFAPEPRFGLAMHRFLAAPSVASYERFMDFCAFDLDGAKQRLGGRWGGYAEYAVDRALDAGVQSATGGLIGLYGGPARVDILHRLKVPVGLIWGREDAATPLAVAQHAAERYGWPLRVIDRAGDDPPLDQPAEFVRVLLDLVGGGDGDGRR